MRMMPLSLLSREANRRGSGPAAASPSPSSEEEGAGDAGGGISAAVELESAAASMPVGIRKERGEAIVDRLTGLVGRLTL